MTIRLRGPADVVAALPYQLGYHPQDCLVVICLHDREVGMVQRIDLPPPAEVDAAVESLVGPLLREAPGAAVLVGYETDVDASVRLLERLGQRLVDLDVVVLDTLVVRDGRYFNPLCGDGCCPPEGTTLPDPSTTPAVADLVALGKVAMSGRAELAASVAADGEVSALVGELLARRRAAGPAARRPPAGTAFGLSPGALPGAPPEASPEASTGAPPGVSAGAPPGVSAGTSSGVDGPTRAGGGHFAAVRRLRHLASWAALCDPRDELRIAGVITPEQVADLVESLRDVVLRDAIIAWLCPGTLPLELIDEDVVDAVRCSLPPPRPRAGGRRGRSHRVRSVPGGGARDQAAELASTQLLLARLQWVCRSVPDQDAAAVLTVLASVAWWHGDGTLARVAVDRALEHRPDYRLAGLVSRTLDLGLRPGREGAGLASAG